MKYYHLLILGVFFFKYYLITFFFLNYFGQYFLIYSHLELMKPSSYLQYISINMI